MIQISLVDCFTDLRNKNSILGAIQDYNLVKQLQQRVPRPKEERKVKKEMENEENDIEKIEDVIEEVDETPGDVNMAQMFYMATLGGAKGW